MRPGALGASVELARIFGAKNRCQRSDLRPPRARWLGPGLLLAALFGLGSSAWAADEGAALLRLLQDRNAELDDLAGQFRQRKTLEALPVPLVATGRFQYHREEGIEWVTEAPVSNRVKIDDRGVYLSDQTLLQDQAQGAIGQAIARVFIAMFSGDIQLLQSYFDIAGEGDINAWTLRLKPVHPALAEMLKSIEITGGQHTDTVTIREVSGDVTELELSVSTPDGGPSHP